MLPWPLGQVKRVRPPKESNLELGLSKMTSVKSVDMTLKMVQADCVTIERL